MEGPKKRLRSWVIMVIFVVIILAIAGIGFWVIKNVDVPNVVLDKDAAALVNGDAITFDELNFRYDSLPEQYKLFVLKGTILDQMIADKLLLQEARKKGIIITDEDVNMAIQNAIVRLGMKEETFWSSTLTGNLTKEDVIADYKIQIAIARLLEQEVTSKIVVQEIEVKNYYNTHLDQFLVDEQRNVSHILVCYEGTARCTQTRTKDEAFDLISNLDVSSSNFGEVAKESSDDTSALLNEGNLGYVTRNTSFVPEFLVATFNAKKGVISEPFETDFGYHIVLVSDIKTNDTLPFESVADSIAQQIYSEKEKENVALYVENLKENATIVNNYISIKDSNKTQVPTGVTTTSIQIESLPQCLPDHNVSLGTVIFYKTSADWCAVCNEMDDIMAELGEEGYRFYVSDVSLKTDKVVKKCFNDIINLDSVPQFICTRNGDFKVGSLTKQELKAFADGC